MRRQRTASKLTQSWRLFYTPADLDVSGYMAALDEYIVESTSSREAAAQSLMEAGILDKKGRLHKRYRR